MARAYTTWTVLPHKPIEKLSDNLWRVSGTMADGKTQRQMVLARMGDGRVVVHNAIALDDAEMKELEAWGTPSVIFVPNGYHRMDARIWKQRYPKAQVIAPAGSKKRVEKVVPVDGITEDAPRDETVRLVPLEGVPSESVLEVRSGDRVSLVFCDAVLNMPTLGFPMNVFLGPTGRVSAPRVMRMLAMKDKRAFIGQLARLADTRGLDRIMFGHGRPITEGCAAALHSVVTQLGG
ncbi:MAG: hypothetical protein SFX73_16570 [Kofleriaceae bacterium]|nr:hypothetical protein [Kofleriaceae bacterium]